ncbi:MAG: helix-turn-helix domain-containing protein [Gemmatimonadetes bacterium]|nr:helix-turn-helix domain-containing protein [Gemmatimonadota bacterium]
MDDETPKVLGDLSVEEAGAVLKRSASTVRQYARQGFLPGAYRQQGREWRVPPEAIRTFQRREAERPLETAPAPPDGRKPSMHSGLTGWRDEWKDAAPIVQAGPVGVADPLTGSSLRASLAGALHRGAPRWP